MKILELFSGYGSQSLALKRLGIEHESHISEIDKYAIDTYNQIHGKTHNWGDITKIDEKELPQYDLITYSFPCQDISNAGKRRGLSKDSGTRSSLLWECERIIEATKPKYLLMENVKPLVGEENMPSFREWLRTLEDLGYRNYWKVLNSKDFNVPQNRERVFCVSILKELNTTYEFPKPKKLERVLKDLLEDDVAENFYLKQEQVDAFMSSNFQSTQRRLQTKDHCDTLCARDYKDPKCVEVKNEIIQVDNYKEKPYLIGNIYGENKGTGFAGNVWDKNCVCPTLTTMQGGGRQPMIVRKTRIRKLTPRECWRLMGVEDVDFNKIKGISNSQLYKMAGNSIVIDVLVEMFRNLLVDKVQAQQTSIFDFI